MGCVNLCVHVFMHVCVVCRIFWKYVLNLLMKLIPRTSNYSPTPTCPQNLTLSSFRSYYGTFLTHVIPLSTHGECNRHRPLVRQSNKMSR